MNWKCGTELGRIVILSRCTTALYHYNNACSADTIFINGIISYWILDKPLFNVLAP